MFDRTRRFDRSTTLQAVLILVVLVVYFVVAFSVKSFVHHAPELVEIKAFTADNVWVAVFTPLSGFLHIESGADRWLSGTLQHSLSRSPCPLLGTCLHSFGIALSHSWLSDTPSLVVC